jgi:hypothetical protein
MNSGRPFSSEVRDLLVMTAKQLVEENQDTRRIKSKFCEGIVKTEGVHASIGTIAGQLFEGDLEIASGRTTVHYLVRTQDLEDFEPNKFEWTDWMGASEFQDTIREDHRRRSLS